MNNKDAEKTSFFDKTLTPILDIYVSKIEDTGENLILPAAREEEIRSISCESVKKEKRYAFLLLRYAMEKSLGIKMEDVEFSRLDSGRWVCPVCEFSISHSSGWCAVAVSGERVGVDIEKIVQPRAQGFAKRALSDEEFIKYSSLSAGDALNYLILKWCEKESAFKVSDCKAFVPCETKTLNCSSRIIRLSDEEFALGICAKDISHMRIYIDIR